MEQFGWPLIMTVFGGIVAVLSGLFVEFAKQFIPQLDETQRAKVIRQAKLAVWAARGAILGLLFGVWIAVAFCTEPVMTTITIEEGPLTEGAPKAAPQPLPVPSGRTKFTDNGSLVILACGVGGGLIGYGSKWAERKAGP